MDRIARGLFQSTLLQEERRRDGNQCTGRGTISIHAPTRGATRETSLLQMGSSFQSTLLQEERHLTIFNDNLFNHFNPRSYKRSDNLWAMADLREKLFQSTLLQEERQQKCTIFLMHLCNNYCIVSI